MPVCLNRCQFHCRLNNLVRRGTAAIAACHAHLSTCVHLPVNEAGIHHILVNGITLYDMILFHISYFFVVCETKAEHVDDNLLLFFLILINPFPTIVYSLMILLEMAL